MEHSLEEYMAFYKKISLINLFTCCSLFLYSSNIITSTTAVNAEVLITLYKWYEELNYGYKLTSFEVTSHHLGAFALIGFANINIPHKMDAIVKGLIIHIPFLFKSVRASTQNFIIKKYAGNIYLLLWFPCSTYRLVTLFGTTRELYLENNFFAFFVGTLYCLLFLYLDISWTPWNKYRRMIMK